MGSKLKTSTATMTHQGRSAMLHRVIFHMTSNPYFPEPWGGGLSLAMCIALAEKYDSWIGAADRGDRDNIATRNEVAVEVQNLLDRLAHYVEMVAGDNLTALRSSGFELRQRHGKSNSSHTPEAYPYAGAGSSQEPTVESLPDASKVVLHAPWGPGIISREVQTTTGNPVDEAAWSEKAVFVPDTKMEMECAAGLNTFFRYRDITEAGVGDWSKAVSTQVN
jgi:hypothetical protein